ncbi:hydroxyethylthiazole kinase-like [Phalaenopsis equestris]|uniref:hydroxyethylthiazole kinase-like n=1 Tax=Phalaenopsis equestris TaxID=78828 RepID=UPI0009E19152|nr:hydroxyethylthiazole kinase-like [Phalaenopsis equestris]
MDPESDTTATAPAGKVPQLPLPHQLDHQWGLWGWELLQKLRSRAPLVQCITNFVSMDLMANVLLAAGACPAMIWSLREISDFTPGVGALCINVGTLSEDGLSSMRAAAAVAAEAAGRPWVLDPAAVSASDFRMEGCIGLLELRPAVIRGNASEILALASARRIKNSKGADSTHKSSDAFEAAKSLSQSSGAIVAVSGAVDFITDGRIVVAVQNGVAMLQKITATGCAVTALIAAFIAIEQSNILEATACALSIFGVAAELGMEKATGPASLRMHLIDSLHGLNEHLLVPKMCIMRVY